MAKTGLKITKEKLAEKIGAENLVLVLNNVYCADCGPTAMVGYEDDIVLEPSGNTILHCKCKKCGHKVARLLETGEEHF